MAEIPNYELLNDAFAIIEGLPPTAVTLDWARTVEGITLSDGILHHPARWLSIHPRFQARGLAAKTTKLKGFSCLTLNGQEWPESRYANTLAMLFRIPVSDVIYLFAERGVHLGDDINPRATDHEVWLQRVRRYREKNAALAPFAPAA